MSERKPAYWVLKNREGLYYAGCDRWSEERLESCRCGTEDGAGAMARVCGGRVVPVYVTVRKVKRGHSWAWACKRMLEGKRVRRASWGWSVFVSACPHVTFSESDMRATDWEVAP